MQETCRTGRCSVNQRVVVTIPHHAGKLPQRVFFNPSVILSWHPPECDLPEVKSVLCVDSLILPPTSAEILAVLTPEAVVQSVVQMGITHVVWIPDSVMGTWETGLEQSSVQLIRVCREGECWPLAAGLYTGGARPLIMMQTTGLFESGDALRNIVYDLKVPVYAWVGVRNWMNPQSPDSARRFTLPVIDAWQLDHVWVNHDQDLPQMKLHYEQCRNQFRAGIALIAEGAG
jgi:sulfopyruvate decarboxylase subunit alpha